LLEQIPTVCVKDTNRSGHLMMIKHCNVFVVHKYNDKAL